MMRMTITRNRESKYNTTEGKGIEKYQTRLNLRISSCMQPMQSTAANVNFIDVWNSGMKYLREIFYIA